MHADKQHIYYINHGKIYAALFVNWRAYYRVGDTDTKIFGCLPTILLFSISPAQRSINNISKLLLHFITCSTKIIESGNVKFPKSISSSDGLWREFLGSDSNSTFPKKCVLQKREFPYSFFQSISNNNLDFTK